MARILLGVSGGIAAYKALELARLATVAGHGVRVLMTEGADPLRRRRLLRGHRRRPGADLGVRARSAARRLPRRPGARARPDRPPRARRQLRRLPGRPGLGQHAGQAGGRDRRLDGHHLLPRLRRAAPRRPGDERPHVRATRRRRPTWRPCASAGVTVIEPDEGALASRGEHGKGRLPDPARLLARLEAVLPERPPPLGRPPRPGHRRRHPRADRLGPLPRQPLQRPHGPRPRRRRRPPRRRRDPDRRQRLPARAARRPPHRRRETAAELAEAARAEFPATHVLLMAAAPADFRTERGRRRAS